MSGRWLVLLAWLFLGCGSKERPKKEDPDNAPSASAAATTPAASASASTDIPLKSTVFLYPPDCGGPKQSFLAYESADALAAKTKEKSFDIHCGTKGTLWERNGTTAEVRIDETAAKQTHVWLPYADVHLERHPKAPEGAVAQIVDKEQQEDDQKDSSGSGKDSHRKHKKKKHRHGRKL